VKNHESSAQEFFFFLISSEALSPVSSVLQFF